jgi:hypothetical protein
MNPGYRAVDGRDHTFEFRNLVPGALTQRCHVASGQNENVPN